MKMKKKNNIVCQILKNRIDTKNLLKNLKNLIKNDNIIVSKNLINVNGMIQ